MVVARRVMKPNGRWATPRSLLLQMTADPTLSAILSAEGPLIKIYLQLFHGIP